MSSKLTDILLDLNLWAGAVLGALVSAAFAVSWTLIRSAIQRLPRRQLLGTLGSDSQPCEITMRILFSEDGKFVSFSAPGYIEFIQNTQYAYGVGDVEAAMRVINLLGQVRHSTGIQIVAVQEAAELRDLPSIAIGGTPRAIEILQLVPELATSCSGDKIISNGHEFGVDYSFDHAVICRASRDDIKNTHFAIFGLHWAGTRTAGAFFEKNAATLGSVFGKKSFVIVLRCKMSTDTSQVAVVHHAPELSWFVRLFHPLASYRFTKLCV